MLVKGRCDKARKIYQVSFMASEKRWHVLTFRKLSDMLLFMRCFKKVKN